jgi:hypothetical protein
VVTKSTDADLTVSTSKDAVLSLFPRRSYFLSGNVFTGGHVKYAAGSGVVNWMRLDFGKTVWIE